VVDAADPGVQLRSVRFSPAGQLVPAYEVGGDLFDYAAGTDELFVSVIDAMGHGLRASLLGTLAVTALRNARRTGLALADQLRQADRVLHPQFGGGAVRHRACRAHRPGHRVSRGGVNAGHPPPYLLRDGTITALDVPPNVPLGMFEGSQYVECPAPPGGMP